MIAEGLLCLALNVYHEAKNQSLIGQIAVAQVVLNRVHDHRYPNTICEVVKQGETYSWKPDYPVKFRCQFTWYCDGKNDEPDRSSFAWEQALTVAHGVYYGNVMDMVQGATHYHADYVQPSWASSKTYITRIDDHIFYRWDVNYGS
tara:strand:- start:41 stop:478 length:438 start_codon:yes stop_codon:yes gene_type:complete